MPTTLQRDAADSGSTPVSLLEPTSSPSSTCSSTSDNSNLTHTAVEEIESLPQEMASEQQHSTTPMRVQQQPYTLQQQQQQQRQQQQYPQIRNSTVVGKSSEVETSSAPSQTNSEDISLATEQANSQPLRKDGEPPSSQREDLPGWRVKLYQLNKEGQWDDHGTGQVSCRFSDENSCEAYLNVLAEDADDKRQSLFWGKVACGAGVYQRQRDTIITWQQPDMMVDLALSFQDVEGCQDIWDALQKVQQRYNQMLVEDAGTHESIIQHRGKSPTVQDSVDRAHELPPISVENCHSVSHTFDIALSQAQAKPALSRFFLENPKYIEDVIDVFECFQKSEDTENIILAFKIVWSMFRLNDSAVISLLLSDDMYLRVANVIDVGLEAVSGASERVGQQSEVKERKDQVETASAVQVGDKEVAKYVDSKSGRHGEGHEAGQLDQAMLRETSSLDEEDGIVPMDIDVEDNAASISIVKDTSSGSLSRRNPEKANSMHEYESDRSVAKKKHAGSSKNIEYGKGWLGQQLTGSQFKQVAPIADSQTLEKIHANFRVLTLMDVVQATDQMLDGQLHQCFLGMVAQNSEEVIRSLADDDIFMDGLFRAMNKGAASKGATFEDGVRSDRIEVTNVAKAQTRAEFLACTTRLDALRCLQEMCNQARQMQQRTSAMLHDAVVQFKWKTTNEDKRNNKTLMHKDDNSSPSADSSAGAWTQAGGDAEIRRVDHVDAVHDSSSKGTSASSILMPNQITNDASSPTVFFGIMSSIIGSVDTSTKELLVTTDLLLSLVLHAPIVFQKFVIESGEHPHASLNSVSGGLTGLPNTMAGQSHGNPHVFCDGKLLQHICARLIGDNEESVQLTCLEILKAVLDPTRMDDTKEEFLGIFYDHYIAQIVGSLARKLGDETQEEPQTEEFGFQFAMDHQNIEAMWSSQVHVLDFLCFAVEHHTYRIKYYVLRQNVVGLALKLLDCPQKYVQLAAIRFAITCVNRNENFYNR